MRNQVELILNEYHVRLTDHISNGNPGEFIHLDEDIAPR